MGAAVRADPTRRAPRPLLELRGLVCHYRDRSVPGGVVRAVDGVDLDLAPGQALGLVGESGCGKSTLARAALGLRAPTAGTVRLVGRELGRGRAQRRALGRTAQIVMQDPRGSLDPRHTVGACVAEPLAIHGLTPPGPPRRAAAAALLARVGLGPDLLDRRPGALSGGECQRVAIARALAVSPALLVADEPVSALDVSVQAQVLNLLADLRERLGLALLLISHDLAVVRQVCDSAAVMYLGRIVEAGPVAALFARPRHPYTAALLAAVPEPDPMAPPRVVARGEPASAARPPAGCRFHPRCPKVRERCREVDPRLGPDGPACHFPLDDAEREAWLGPGWGEGRMPGLA